MNITPRERKLLMIWPIIWPIDFYFIFRHHTESDWRQRFLMAVGIVIAGFAVAYIAPKLWRMFRKRKIAPSAAAAGAAAGFTLIELLVVIAIIGLLAALVAPVVAHMRKGDSGVTATRQMLDDCARARQLAISRRTTVYMVFVPTNFWQDPLRSGGPNQWNLFTSKCPTVATSQTVSNMYAAQLNGYAIYSLRDVGAQPGQHYPRDLMTVKTLPDHYFFAPIKFTWPQYSFNPALPTTPFFIRTNFAMYGFLTTNSLPFPSAGALTNASYATILNSNPSAHFPTVPYIAFNYLGQLTTGDGSLLPYDEIIPLAFGVVGATKTQTPPTVTEDPPGNSTNISFTLIHIDRFTGRARVESQETL
jgi:prepilin-type N-terminal cleavage/methylation domain-containing protein